MLCWTFQICWKIGKRQAGFSWWNQHLAGGVVTNWKRNSCHWWHHKGPFLKKSRTDYYLKILVQWILKNVAPLILFRNESRRVATGGDSGGGTVVKSTGLSNHVKLSPFRSHLALLPRLLWFPGGNVHPHYVGDVANLRWPRSPLPGPGGQPRWALDLTAGLYV